MASALCDPQPSTRPTTHDAGLADTTTAHMAAIVDLLARIQSSGTLDEACHVLADALCSHLKCHQVFVGVCAEGSTTCHVTAISRLVHVPRQGETVQAIQAAMHETIARNTLTVWPAPDPSQQYALLAHVQCATSVAAHHLISTPLRDERGTTRGAVVISDPDDPASQVEIGQFLRAAESPIATAMQLLTRAERGRLLTRGAAFVQSLRSRKSLVVVGVFGIVAAALCVPVPYRVNCVCQLEPVTRRFVAAPFAAPLKDTLVEPGDLVSTNQLLAQLDGRDIRWELSGAQAELHRANKELAGHVAAHESGKAEIARNEVDRLQLKTQLLEARERDLDIRSPSDGLVVSGDLQDEEGVPLEVGQVLFEVAPLDEMVVELSIPEDDFTAIETGMPVRIKLDALPWQHFEACVDRLHPRAEIRDDQNVFVAEVPLDNATRTLHPGMRGRAKISAGNAALGWVLFRRPLAAALQWLGW